MRALARRVLRHWPLKVAALTLSVIVWVLVSAEETTSELVEVRLALDVPPSLTLAGPAPPVRALVTGTGREIIKLYATPLLIHRAVPATAAAQWRTAIGPGDVTVPNHAAVTVQDVEPRDLVVDLDRLARRTVPVALRGAVEPRPGWALDGPVRLTPDAVRVSGPRALVQALDSVRTEAVEWRGLDADFERAAPLDTAAHPLLRFSAREIVVTGRLKRS